MNCAPLQEAKYARINLFWGETGMSKSLRSSHGWVRTRQHRWSSAP